MSDHADGPDMWVGPGHTVGPKWGRHPRSEPEAENLRLLAENQRLRDALQRIHFVARFDSEPYEIAMTTLYRTPSAAQTLEDTPPHKESRSSSNAS